MGLQREGVEEGMRKLHFSTVFLMRESEVLLGWLLALLPFGFKELNRSISSQSSYNFHWNNGPELMVQTDLGTLVSEI